MVVRHAFLPCISIRMPSRALISWAWRGGRSYPPPNGLWRKSNDVCEANGLPKVGVHGLRHSFASLAYSLGFKEEECMRIGGWSDYRIMHEIYTHLAARDLAARVKEMENFYKENL